MQPYSQNYQHYQPGRRADRLYTPQFSGDELLISQSGHDWNAVGNCPPSFQEQIAQQVPELLPYVIGYTDAPAVRLPLWLVIGSDVAREQARNAVIEAKQARNIEQINNIIQAQLNGEIPPLFTLQEGKPICRFNAVITYRKEYVTSNTYGDWKKPNVSKQTLRGDKYTNQPPKMIINLLGTLQKRRGIIDKAFIVDELLPKPGNVVYELYRGDVVQNNVDKWLTKILAA